jgi:hypothetical protein
MATDYNIIRCMRDACFITRTVDTHSYYVIPIAFPEQQRLRERVLFIFMLVVICTTTVQHTCGVV